MDLKEKYGDRATKLGNSVGLLREHEKHPTRWWYVGNDAAEAVFSLVNIAVNEALEFAQKYVDDLTEMHNVEAARASKAEQEARALRAKVSETERSAQEYTDRHYRQLVQARRQHTDASREAEDLRARLNGAKADKEVLQRERDAAQARAAHVEAQLRAAARNGGQHALGEDQARERARHLDEVRRQGLNDLPEVSLDAVRRFMGVDKAAPGGDYTVVSTFQRGRSFRLDANANMLDIVEKHGLDAFDHALRDARYKHTRTTRHGRVCAAVVKSVGPLRGRRVELAVIAGTDLKCLDFVDIFSPGADKAFTSGATCVMATTELDGAVTLDVELAAASDYMFLRQGCEIYLAP